MYVSRPVEEGQPWLVISFGTTQLKFWTDLIGSLESNKVLIQDTRWMTRWKPHKGKEFSDISELRQQVRVANPYPTTIEIPSKCPGLGNEAHSICIQGKEPIQIPCNQEE